MELDNILKRAMTQKKSDDDYMQDGLLHCGKCHTPKQKLMDVPFFTKGQLKPFPVMCECQQREEGRKRREKEKTDFTIKMAHLWSNGIQDKALLNWHFADDDGSQPQATEVAKRYCNQWQEITKNNVGVLLSGPVGTGKTFLASCIANELLENCVSVCTTSLPRILNVLQATFDKQPVLDQLTKFQLLVLDDFGSERTSEFALEQTFAIIDARNRVRKPIIITTNLPIKEFKDSGNLAYRRIFDRIWDMCPVRVPVTGESHRRASANVREGLARSLLQGG